MQQCSGRLQHIASCISLFGPSWRPLRGLDGAFFGGEGQERQAEQQPGPKGRPNRKLPTYIGFSMLMVMAGKRVSQVRRSAPRAERSGTDTGRGFFLQGRGFWGSEIVADLYTPEAQGLGGIVAAGPGFTGCSSDIGLQRGRAITLRGPRSPGRGCRGRGTPGGRGIPGQPSLGQPRQAGGAQRSYGVVKQYMRNAGGVAQSIVWGEGCAGTCRTSLPL